jgi:hypothetical protein
MVTAKFTLTFPDGAIATAQIKAESADAEYEVAYSGAVERLPERFDTADVRVLRAWAKGVARETGAAVNEQIEGEYDRFAE